MAKRNDAVVVSDEIAADTAARLILKIKRINQDTKILIIADEDSEPKTKILDYNADELIVKPTSSEHIADKVFNLLVGIL
jgi:DNA-binding NarL/FixJ family response regulator